MVEAKVRAGVESAKGRRAKVRIRSGAVQLRMRKLEDKAPQSHVISTSSNKPYMSHLENFGKNITDLEDMFT